MGTKIKASKKGARYNMEDMVDPSMFFDAGCWKAGRMGSKQIRMTISEKHMYLADRLRESGLFRMKSPDMNRGLLILGLVTEALYYTVCDAHAHNIVSECSNSRRKINAAALNLAISYLRKNDKSDQMLFENFIRYGDCIYGGSILGYIPQHAQNNPQPRKDVSIVVQPDIKTLCKNFSKDVPDANKFKLKKSNGNKNIPIWVPNQIKILSYSLLHRSIHKTMLMSDMYRAGYVTGLYVLCKWILEEDIPKDEYCFSKILHNIYIYMSENPC